MCVSERTNARPYRPHPIKQALRDRGQSQSWVARRLGMSESYVRGMVSGVWPASRRFRDGAVAILGLSEADLFHDDGVSRGGAPVGSDAGLDEPADTGLTALYATGEEGRIVRIA